MPIKTNVVRDINIRKIYPTIYFRTMSKKYLSNSTWDLCKYIDIIAHEDIGNIGA